MSSVSFRHDGRRIVVDRSSQILEAELSDVASWQEWPPPSSVSVDIGDGISTFENDATWPAPRHATIAATGLDKHFTPAFALAWKAKSYDDRVVECIERIAHDGAGAHDGLYLLTRRLREELPEGGATRGLLDAAFHLAGNPLPEAGAARLHARKWLARFLTDAKASKPVGIYTASAELRSIFQHDRLLQLALSQQDAAPLRALLAANPALRRIYERHLALCARTTGRLVGRGIDDCASPTVSFLPPSDSLEAQLMKREFGDRAIPEGFELGRALIERIRSGAMRTEPTPEEGWYAYQFHALAALLDPESARLRIGPMYRAELEDTFRALFAINRETHVKQLELPMAGGMPLIVQPSLTIEPLPAYYHRVADGYAYLHAALVDVLDEAVVYSESVPSSSLTLGHGLADMEVFFRGAAAVARWELGEPLTDAYAASRFRTWQTESAADPDFNQDTRVAVPVYFDLLRETVRICVTVGIETRTLTIGFAEPPVVQVLGGEDAPGEPSEPIFATEERMLLSPITIECDVTSIPNRKQLREICDAHETIDEIRDALEAL